MRQFGMPPGFPYVVGGEVPMLVGWCVGKAWCQWAWVPAFVWADLGDG